MENTHPIVFFDGVCNLCNGTVNFLIRNDKKQLFRFCPLQSERGNSVKKSLEKNGSAAPESIILQTADGYYTKSTAVLKIVRLLGGRWVLLYPFILIPRPIRDGVYDVISKKRYQWFGRSATCMLPDKALVDRFLSE